MEEKLFNKFKELSINEKRNEINSEMEKLFVILNQLMSNYKGNTLYQGVANYDSTTNINMSEDIYLEQIYRDTMNIRKVLMDYLAWKE